MFKRAFVLFSEHEMERIPHLEAMRTVLPSLEMVEPVFPSRVHVPFLEAMMKKSLERTGKALLPTEIGVILSHRKENMMWVRSAAFLVWGTRNLEMCSTAADVLIIWCQILLLIIIFIIIIVPKMKSTMVKRPI